MKTPSWMPFRTLIWLQSTSPPRRRVRSFERRQTREATGRQPTVEEKEKEQAVKVRTFLLRQVGTAVVDGHWPIELPTPAAVSAVPEGTGPLWAIRPLGYLNLPLIGS